MQDDALVVMLVEDNPAHAEIIIRLLQEHCITPQIQHVSDGEAALDYLFRRGAYADRFTYPEPHLVLLDLRLPKVDGLEVLRQIKASERLRLLPVVVLSSSEAQGDIAAAYRQHVNSYLVKPVDYKKFVVLIESLVVYWLTLNRQPLP
ncbi:MAG: response regulator [Desulfosarcina sp.]|nr:response regulator [Desulfosarcina sp.]